MKIKFIPYIQQEYEWSILIIDFFESFFGKQIHSTIDTLFITENGKYLQTIKEIDINETVTDNEKNVGIAKTIYVEEIDKSNIIIKNYCFSPILKIILEGKDVDNWDENELDLTYTMFHEIGHAIDNKNVTKRDKKIVQKPFRLNKVSNYYCEVILREIGANINATKYLPLQFKEKGRTSLISHIKDTLTDVENLTINKTSEITEIEAFDLIGCISVLILKIQEVYIHKPNSLEKSHTCFNFNNIIDYEIEQWINTIIKNYPDCKNVESTYLILINLILNSYGIYMLEDERKDLLIRK